MHNCRRSSCRRGSLRTSIFNRYTSFLYFFFLFEMIHIYVKWNWDKQEWVLIGLALSPILQSPIRLFFSHNMTDSRLICFGNDARFPEPSLTVFKKIPAMLQTTTSSRWWVCLATQTLPNLQSNYTQSIVCEARSHAHLRLTPTDRKKTGFWVSFNGVTEWKRNLTRFRRSCRQKPCEASRR